jgi:GT2 family glycosyltransferase
LSQPSVTVVIPTLAADHALTECLVALERQTRPDIDVIVVDNSGSGKATALLPAGSRARIVANRANVGFGRAVNQGIENSQSRYVAALNDDAVPQPDWADALVRAADAAPDAGLFASQVRLQDTAKLDSAGMLIAADGSSKQRGHGADAAVYRLVEDVLLPSGSAAMYRREMLEQTGGFDDDFFLYCEDTDLGLRARWAGWRCVYVADAIVQHRYSHSAGRASALKAYYVERNRIFVAVKNFPVRLLLTMPFATAVRYLWHLAYLLQGRGKAAELAKGDGGATLAWVVVRAHAAAVAALPSLIAKRRRIRATARLTSGEFCDLLRRYSVPLREVASH